MIRATKWIVVGAALSGAFRALWRAIRAPRFYGALSALVFVSFCLATESQGATNAVAKIRQRAMLDHPSSVTISCHSEGRWLSCWVTETNAETYVTDNGVRIRGTLSYGVRVHA